MDEEQSLASPIAGSLRGIRRSVSSSIFNSRSRGNQIQQSDPITTNLLQQNALTLNTLSRRFEIVATQISSLNISLAGIKENLALNEALEKQREAAKQKREAILAEQGLREGKESALEEKIRFSLTEPIKKVAGKVQAGLFSLEKFFLILAGGWLTSKGIQLLQSLAEGNTLKLERLKEEFLKGLLIIGGTITALTIGLGTTFSLIGKFALTVGRVAFGGLLRNSFRGITQLLGKVLARLAPLLPFLSGFGGKALQNLGKIFGGGLVGGVAIDQVSKNILGGDKVSGGKNLPLITGGNEQKLITDGAKNIKPKTSLFQRLKNFFGKNLNISRQGSTKVLTQRQILKNFNFNPLKGKNIIGVIIGMLLGQSFDEAIVSMGAFQASVAIASAKLSPLLLAPFPGARPLYGLLVLAAGIFGPAFVDGIYKSIKGFIFGKKENKTDIDTLTMDDILLESDAIKAGLIEPIKSNTEQTADLISQDIEGETEFINFPLSEGNGKEVAANTGAASNNIPNITFGNIGDYKLLSQSSYGAGG